MLKCTVDPIASQKNTPVYPGPPDPVPSHDVSDRADDVLAMFLLLYHDQLDRAARSNEAVEESARREKGAR